jgi:hypothetical protein
MRGQKSGGCHLNRAIGELIGENFRFDPKRTSSLLTQSPQAQAASDNEKQGSRGRVTVIYGRGEFSLTQYKIRFLYRVGSAHSAVADA